MRFYMCPSRWWFRIFGRGILVEDHRVYPPLFSERYGKRRHIHFGNWCIRYLPKRWTNK
jgi:hypothetical protein